MNRITMRFCVGLHLYLWENIINTIIYLINRGPFSALNGGITEEMSIGKRVNYSSLKVSIYEDFLHIDKDFRNNLDATSLKCYFIRYGIGSLGYILWDVDNQKIIIIRDVIFNETTCTKIGCMLRKRKRNMIQIL